MFCSLPRRGSVSTHWQSHGIKRELNSPPELSNANSPQSYKKCARAHVLPRDWRAARDEAYSQSFYATQSIDYSKSFAMARTPVSDAEDWKVWFKMNTNGSILSNISSLPPHELTLSRPPWLSCTLGSVLIFTIVVDILGNLLVIISVYRNKKLRNAGKPLHQGCPHFQTSLSLTHTQHHTLTQHSSRATCMHDNPEFAYIYKNTTNAL